MNVEDDFINQVGFEETFRELAAAEDDDAFAFLLLQLLNELRGVRGDDFDILVGLLRRQFLSQRGALCLHASEDVILRAGIRGLTVGEHPIASLAPDQERVDGLHELSADLGDFLAPVNPIESTILASDVVVETVGETEGYFSHKRSPLPEASISPSTRPARRFRSVGARCL